MVNEIHINSDGTVDAYDENGVKNRYYSGDWCVLITIMKNLDICINGRPSSLREELRIKQSPNFYFKVPTQTDAIRIPKAHVAEMIKHIKENPNIKFCEIKVKKKSKSIKKTPEPESDISVD